MRVSGDTSAETSASAPHGNTIRTLFASFASVPPRMSRFSAVPTRLLVFVLQLYQSQNDVIDIERRRIQLICANQVFLIAYKYDAHPGSLRLALHISFRFVGLPTDIETQNS